MVFVSWVVTPILIEAVVGETDTAVTAIVDEVTVIALVAVLAPSAVVTVIVAEPEAIPVTKPLVFTVATDALLVLQVTF
jgi:hypothetical protein